MVIGVESIPLYGGGYVLYIVALVFFPNMSGKGFHNGGMWKGTSSTVYPDESSLRLRKASGGEAAVGSLMTSVLPSWRSWSCCTEMVTFG